MDKTRVASQALNEHPGGQLEQDAARGSQTIGVAAVELDHAVGARPLCDQDQRNVTREAGPVVRSDDEHDVEPAAAQASGDALQVGGAPDDLLEQRFVVRVAAPMLGLDVATQGAQLVDEQGNEFRQRPLDGRIRDKHQNTHDEDLFVSTRLIVRRTPPPSPFQPFIISRSKTGACRLRLGASYVESASS